MTACPVPNCGNTVHEGHLMCFGHWRAVHFTLQMKVQRTWKNSDDGDDDEVLANGN